MSLWLFGARLGELSGPRKDIWAGALQAAQMHAQPLELGISGSQKMGEGPCQAAPAKVRGRLRDVGGLLHLIVRKSFPRSDCNPKGLKVRLRFFVAKRSRPLIDILPMAEVRKCFALPTPPPNPAAPSSPCSSFFLHPEETFLLATAHKFSLGLGSSGHLGREGRNSDLLLGSCLALAASGWPPSLSSTASLS